VYQLHIANKNYSSWSLRPWVLLHQLGIEFEECFEPFETEDNFEKFRKFSPSGTVPCLVDGDTVVWDSLAIVEYLAEKEAGIWPDGASARAFARSASAEMHSSFSSLRKICPMNCAIRVALSSLTADLARDVSRIDELWREGLRDLVVGFWRGKDLLQLMLFTARWHSGCRPTNCQFHLSRLPTVKNCFRCRQWKPGMPMRLTSPGVKKLMRKRRRQVCHRGSKKIVQVKAAKSPSRPVRPSKKLSSWPLDIKSLTKHFF